MNSSFTPPLTTPHHSLRLIASKHVNWTLVLRKHPQTTFPRIRDLYDEYVNHLEKGHKQRITQCITEAFYHNMSVDQLSHEAETFFTIAQASDWAVGSTISQAPKQFPHHPSHALKVISAALITTAITWHGETTDNGTTQAFFHQIVSSIDEWQADLNRDQSLTHFRIIDRVVNKNADRLPESLPLIGNLVFDRLTRFNIEDYVKCYAMLPESVLDSIFPPEEYSAE
ncbi:hypothetical protein HK097_010760 [Rhizophlyctis rosea]|uniref:Uncharacterized protein n=1 Tax=Rhizophlyctis rosea TaxID=64517 RepID=A0AAD5S9J0_9FUNG|nr:hypothetical protein HK097_010760 [Rhizophlyctis rosea]